MPQRHLVEVDQESKADAGEAQIGQELGAVFGKDRLDGLELENELPLDEE